jgi:hypothetical protein
MAASSVQACFTSWQGYLWRVQKLLKGPHKQWARAFEALALAGVRDEFEWRHSLLRAKPVQSLDSTGADAFEARQVGQLQQRLTTLTPSKLRGKLPSHGRSAIKLELLSVPGAEQADVIALLEESLHDTEFSVTPDLDGAAPVEMALSMWHAALSWCAPFPAASRRSLVPKHCMARFTFCLCCCRGYHLHAVQLLVWLQIPLIVNSFDSIPLIVKFL